jgi:Phage integrase family
VVLTRQEVQRVLAGMSGTHQLMAKLLYGTGMRLMECVRLRVKDVDFGQNHLVVRDGKGFKDRVTVLPDALKLALSEHLERARKGLAKPTLCAPCVLSWQFGCGWPLRAFPWFKCFCRAQTPNHSASLFRPGQAVMPWSPASGTATEYARAGPRLSQSTPRRWPFGWEARGARRWHGRSTSAAGP